MLYIGDDNLRKIKDQVQKHYPLECCGFLIGTNVSGKRVVSVCPVQNKNTERTHDRYEIDGKEFDKTDREAAKKGLQILGIYHSHPDHPATPSTYDTERAWGGYSYVIAAIEKGEKIDMKSWVLDEETRQFKEESIVLF